MSVYKLYSIECPEQIYVGSTKLPLDRRFQLHKYASKTHDYPVYLHLRKYDVKTWRIELIEEAEEHRKREEFWRRQIGTLNEIKAFQTPEEKAEYHNAWHRQHPESNRKSTRKWKARNPEKVREQNRRHYAKKKAAKALQPFIQAASARLIQNFQVIRRNHQLGGVVTKHCDPRVTAAV